MADMNAKKNVLAINGSASRDSSNERLIANLAAMGGDDFALTNFGDLKKLPPFDPELSLDNTPPTVKGFRKKIEKADAVIICTPEYVFSIPSGLKNALEWCVSTTVFSGKPVGIITASADGQKGHEELQLIMKTLMASFTEETTLLIRGIKGKMTREGQITDRQTADSLRNFVAAFIRSL